MRKPIIAANWKMHKTVKEAMDFVQALKGKLPQENEVDCVLCAPAISLSSLVKEAEGLNLKIGAQNMYFEKQGAFTGEISPVMLEDLGVNYVIIGHSERRDIFKECDEMIQKKVMAAYAHHLTPILCCGESLEAREAGETNDIVKKQVLSALLACTAEQVLKSVIAYEPIWAIGTGKSSSAADADETCGYIRKVIGEKFGTNVAEQIRIQYGGSVKPNNISEYMQKENIDGALVGGASLEPDAFLQLLGAGK